MAQYAVYENTTRVIRVVTTEEPTGLPSGMSYVLMASPIDLSNGPWKLSAGNDKVQASALEYQNSGFDEAYNAQVAAQNFTDYKPAAVLARSRWVTVRDNAALPTDVRQAASATVGFIEAISKLLRSSVA